MSALRDSKNKLKLGIFSANCSSGQAMTQIEERWDSSWDNNLKQAQLCDAAGLEFQLPIARWIGYGATTNFQHNVLETLTWAAGLLAKTRNITIFATTHTGFHNPVIAAKQLATLDQIGHGRAGLNIVCGWNKPEYEALGFQLPDDHETRYRLLQEWFDIVKKCWSDSAGDFDWDTGQGGGRTGETPWDWLRRRYLVICGFCRGVPLFSQRGAAQAGGKRVTRKNVTSDNYLYPVLWRSKISDQ